MKGKFARAANWLLMNRAFRWFMVVFTMYWLIVAVAHRDSILVVGINAGATMLWLWLAVTAKKKSPTGGEP